MTIEVIKLSDGVLSVRVDGREVYILPRRREVTIGDLEDAFQAVMDEAEGGDWE